MIKYSRGMDAVVLSAGMGTRLSPLTDNLPKSLIKVHDKTILDMQLNSLIDSGMVTRIVLLAGFKSEKIVEYISMSAKFKDIVQVVLNEEYATTNNMYSLSLARKYVDGKEFILCNGDVAFTEEVLKNFSYSGESEILIEEGLFNQDGMKVRFNLDGHLSEISKQIESSLSDGTSLDIYKFSGRDSGTLFGYIEKHLKEVSVVDWTEVAINTLCGDKLQMRMIPIKSGNWYEIDNSSDLASARKKFLKNQVNLDDFDFYLFDLDGTLITNDTPIAGAVELLSLLNSKGKTIIYLTNNSGYSDADHLSRLKSIGFQVDNHIVITALNQTINSLKKQGVRSIFLLGSESAARDFIEAGIQISSSAPELVVIANDIELTFEKIEISIRNINTGVPFLATHPDMGRPTRFGILPDAGAFTSMISTATSRVPLRVFGKPDVELIDLIMLETKRRNLLFSPSKALMIGDRLNLDIQFGVNTGIRTVLTLSGATTETDFQSSEITPNFVVDSVSDLIDVFL